MDQKVIDFAIEKGIITDPSELDTMSEFELVSLEGSYENGLYFQGKLKCSITRFLENDDGSLTNYIIIQGYFDESTEEAMRRELTEAGINTNGLTDDEVCNVYIEKNDFIMECYENKTMTTEKPIYG